MLVFLAPEQTPSDDGSNSPPEHRPDGDSHGNEHIWTHLYFSLPLVRASCTYALRFCHRLAHDVTRCAPAGAATAVHEETNNTGLTIPASAPIEAQSTR